MTRFRNCACWAGFGAALLLSPAILVFAAPFGYGICSDLAATTWLVPAAALAGAAAVAMKAVRRTAIRAQAVTAQAAKSIT